MGLSPRSRYVPCPGRNRLLGDLPCNPSRDPRGKTLIGRTQGDRTRQVPGPGSGPGPRSPVPVLIRLPIPCLIAPPRPPRPGAGITRIWPHLRASPTKSWIGQHPGAHHPMSWPKPRPRPKPKHKHKQKPKPKQKQKPAWTQWRLRPAEHARPIPSAKCLAGATECAPVDPDPDPNPDSVSCSSLARRKCEESSCDAHWWAGGW